MASHSFSSEAGSDQRSSSARMKVDSFPQRFVLGKPARCATCRISHTKCEAEKPVCSTCVRLNRKCVYSSAPPPGYSSEPPRVSLFNRTPKACLACRKAKRKCDGVTPTCDSCIGRNLRCEYDNQPIRAPTSNSRPRSSHGAERPAKLPRLSLSTAIIRDLELRPQTESQPGSGLTQKTSSVNEPELGESEESSDNDDSRPSDTDGMPQSTLTIAPHFLHQPIDPQQLREPIRSSSVQSLGHGDLPRQEHQPGIPWAEKLKEAVLHRTDESNPGHTRRSEEEIARLEQSRKNNSGLVKVRPDMKDLTLPSRGVADRFLAAYLTREFVNLPIFHLPTFQAKYMEIWSSEDLLDDMGVFRGILNVMFALGCLVSDPNNRNDATMYFIKAQRLIRLGSIEGDNLTTVQAYIIVSQYLIAVNSHTAAWKSIGVAIRIAETLRLHLKSGTHHLQDRVDRELARRIWYSCILLERMIAISLGFSTIVTPRSFQATLPMPLENEYVDSIFGGKGTPGGDRPSIVEFLVALSRLYERYEDIVSIQQELRFLNNSPVKVLETFDCQPLLDADQKLCNWISALPEFLRPDADHSSLRNAIAKRQNNMLRIRYLHLRLLLWRPLLAHTAASPGLTPQPAILSEQEAARFPIDTPLIYKITSVGAVRCILSAHELLKVLTKNRREDGKLDHLGPIPSWWEIIEYLYTCGLVFLAAHSCPISVYTDLPSGSSTVEDGLQLCIQLLDQYRSFSREAGAHLKAIESLVANLAKSKESAANGAHSLPVNSMSWLESSPQDLPL